MAGARPAKRRKPPRRPATVTASRWVAWNVIRRTFDEDAFTDRAFAGEVERAGLDARDRAFAQQLAWGTVQQAKLVDHVIGAVGKRPLRKIDAPVLHALRLGLYELLVLEADDPWAAVDQAVEIVRATTGERAVAFANAVLRRGQADGPGLLALLHQDDSTESIATRLSLPEWIVERMRDAFGEDGIAELESLVSPEAMVGTTLRCNTLLAEVDAVREALQSEGVRLGELPAHIAPLLHEAIVVDGALGAATDLIDRGHLFPQSAASMLVVALLDPQRGDRVLDLCAAPGGKTFAAAARMGGEGRITAVELHEHRARSIDFLAARLGAAGMVTTRCADARTIDATADGGPWGRVLVDAPCSGLGVLAERPDLRWRRDESDVAELAELQRELLRAAARVAAPDAVIVYSTCTMLPAECEDVVDAIIAEGLLVPDDAPADLAAAVSGTRGRAHEIRTWPRRDGTGGFYAARLRRPAGGAITGAHAAATDTADPAGSAK